MSYIVIALIALGAIGLLAAVILYFVSQKFKVVEDDRIDLIEEILPGANCGGCGFPGCRGFADACVKAESLSALSCPVGGNEVMTKVGVIMGMAVAEAEPMVSVLKCAGSCANRPKTSEYDGAKTCRIASSLYSGETDCAYGCIGFGDCEAVCKFDALHIDKETGLPVIDEEKCTACGACIKACPKHVLEMRKKGPKSRRIWVACSSLDKGGVAKKACSVACIGCGKCEKECNFGAIKIENNCAYIDFEKCKLCRKCVAVCPTGAIQELNFPPRAVKNVAADKKVEKIVAEVVEKRAEKKAEEPIVEPALTLVPEVEELIVVEAEVKEKIDDSTQIVEEEVTIEEIAEDKAAEVKQEVEDVIREEVSEIVETPVVEVPVAEMVAEPTEEKEGAVRSIEDIVNNIMKDSISVNQGEEPMNLDPEVDVEALKRRMEEETFIDPIYKTERRKKERKDDPEEDEDNRGQQQLDLL